MLMCIRCAHVINGLEWVKRDLRGSPGVERDSRGLERIDRRPDGSWVIRGGEGRLVVVTSPQRKQIT